MNIVIVRGHSEGEVSYAADQVVTGMPDCKAGDRIACELAREATDDEVAAAGDAAIAYAKPASFGLGGAPEPEPVKRKRVRKPAAAEAAKPARRPRKPKAAEPA